MSLALYPHQEAAVRSGSARRATLIIRALGSGKTAIALHVAASLVRPGTRPGLLVCPAHLIEQAVQENLRWDLGLPLAVIDSPLGPRIEEGCVYVASFDRLRLSFDDFVRQHWAVVVVDEFHRAKNPKTLNSRCLKRLRNRTPHFVGMTGAPFQNGPVEFFSLIEIVAGKRLCPMLEDCLEFRSPSRLPWLVRSLKRLLGHRLNQGPVVGVRAPDELRREVLTHVDYLPEHEYLGQCGMPTVSEEFVDVEMEPGELAAYKRLLSSHRKQSDRLFMNDGLDDARLAGAYQRVSDLRQCLLGEGGLPSSKVRAVCRRVADIAHVDSNRVLVFSNFVDRGVEVISGELDRLGVRSAQFTGVLTSEGKARTLADYASGDTRVLVLSPVGFEGLDLLGTSHIVVADPHYNPAVTSQLIARATRAGSARRSVCVTHFFSVAGQLKSGTIDQAIHRIARRKAHVNGLISAVLGS